VSTVLSLYEPELIAVAPPPVCVELIAHAASGKLALYVGAGVSRGAPSALALSATVAEDLAERAEIELGLDGHTPDGKTKSLEKLADDAEEAGSLPALKMLAVQVAPFTTLRPNYAHRAIAALLREGAVRVFCVNWDLGIELGGADLGMHLAPAVTDTESLAASGPAYRKVHGCASKSDSLIITTNEVNSPPSWAVAEVQAAISGGVVAYIGLGTVGDYVASRVKQVIVAADNRLTTLVVARSLSTAWREVLQQSVTPQFLAKTADEFLDALLRALVRSLLGKLMASARALEASSQFPAGTVTVGASGLVSTFKAADALSILRWIRDGAQDVPSGDSVAAAQAGQVALLAVAVVLADRSSGMRGRDRMAALEMDACYIEVVIAPGAVSSAVIDAQAMRVAQRRADGIYQDVAKPVLNICVGHIGQLPGAGLVQDIVATHPAMDNILTGPGGATHYWLSGEQLVQRSVVSPL
jgi:hypothetical protein